jgi:NDP-sugar pyrophosphorylase family protein/tRNA A-37 threonylcarbamoyl transferase component Bud32
MKAMILAAGFGTRLHPYTHFTPKPLFTIAGRPILDITIRRLEASGCSAIIVNTHHLHSRISDFLSSQHYHIPVYTSFEPSILGTGGAIKNVAHFWDKDPFMVINSDIVTNIDLKAVYRFHQTHSFPVTLVLHDEPEYNTVWVTSEGIVKGFDELTVEEISDGDRELAFTGIQVIDPEILEIIPENTFHSSIDTYRKTISDGDGVKAFIVTGHYWTDIGTPNSYRQAVQDSMAPMAFKLIDPGSQADQINCEPLAGDGSDRRWYRLKTSHSSLIMVDHGIHNSESCGEVDAFVSIGRHLYSKGSPVPQIFLYDRFAGLVYMQDVGDNHLQDEVKRTPNAASLTALYRPIVRKLISMSIKGLNGFKFSWTYQTPAYDRELILEKECRYFVEAFLVNYLKRDDTYAELETEFSLLAQMALNSAITGFMHRDFQSRNIMLENGEVYFIDFQGGRQGPLQYDLASLLIDPYTQLPEAVQSDLLDYAIQIMEEQNPGCEENFRQGYYNCCLTRNLQILGAFGFLSRTKGKKQFEAYIPAAVKSLYRRLSRDDSNNFPRLKAIVADVAKHISTSCQI